MTDQKFYYYQSRGQSLGPFDITQIQQRAKRAQISNRSQISTDGFSWQPAQNFPEIFAGSSAAPPAAASGPGVVEESAAEETGCWFYMLNGEQQGPVTQEQIQQMIGIGNLKPTDHVWMDGMADWSEIRNVPGLGIQQPQMQQPMMQQPMMQQPGMQQPGMQQPMMQQPMMQQPMMQQPMMQQPGMQQPMNPYQGNPSAAKKFLIIGVVLGVLGGLVLIGGLNMDTTVSTGAGSVHNIGLMQKQKNTIFLGAFIVFCGLVSGGYHFLENKKNS